MWQSACFSLTRSRKFHAWPRFLFGLLSAIVYHSVVNFLQDDITGVWFCRAPNFFVPRLCVTPRESATWKECLILFIPSTHLGIYNKYIIPEQSSYSPDRASLMKDVITPQTWRSEIPFHQSAATTLFSHFENFPGAVLDKLGTFLSRMHLRTHNQQAFARIQLCVEDSTEARL